MCQSNDTLHYQDNVSSDRHCPNYLPTVKSKVVHPSRHCQSSEGERRRSRRDDFTSESEEHRAKKSRNGSRGIKSVAESYHGRSRRLKERDENRSYSAVGRHVDQNRDIGMNRTLFEDFRRHFPSQGHPRPDLTSGPTAHLPPLHGGDAFESRSHQLHAGCMPQNRDVQLQSSCRPTISETNSESVHRNNDSATASSSRNFGLFAVEAVRDDELVFSGHPPVGPPPALPPDGPPPALPPDGPPPTLPLYETPPALPPNGPPFQQNELLRCDPVTNLPPPAQLPSLQCHAFSPNGPTPLYSQQSLANSSNLPRGPPFDRVPLWSVTYSRQQQFPSAHSPTSCSEEQTMSPFLNASNLPSMPSGGSAAPGFLPSRAEYQESVPPFSFDVPASGSLPLTYNPTPICSLATNRAPIMSTLLTTPKPEAYKESNKICSSPALAGDPLASADSPPSSILYGEPGILGAPPQHMRIEDKDERQFAHLSDVANINGSGNRENKWLHYDGNNNCKVDYIFRSEYRCKMHLFQLTFSLLNVQIVKQ